MAPTVYLLYVMAMDIMENLSQLGIETGVITLITSVGDSHPGFLVRSLEQSQVGSSYFSLWTVVVVYPDCLGLNAQIDRGEREAPSNFNVLDSLRKLILRSWIRQTSIIFKT